MDRGGPINCAAAAVAALAALAALAACADGGGGAAGVEGPFPRLAEVPARPPVPGGAERRRMLEELRADHAAAGGAAAAAGARAAAAEETAPPELASAVRRGGVWSGGPVYVPPLRRPAGSWPGAGRGGAVIRFAAGAARPAAGERRRIDRMAEAHRLHGGTVHVVAYAAYADGIDARLAGVALAARRAGAVAARLGSAGVAGSRMRVGVVSGRASVFALAADGGRVALYLSD